jgi:hypothetical protein
VDQPPPVIITSWVELVTIISLLTLAAGGYRKINCHEPWCWRIGRHRVDGTPYIVCHKHHPGLPGSKVKRGHIQAAHAKASS